MLQLLFITFKYKKAVGGVANFIKQEKTITSNYRFYVYFKISDLVDNK